MLSKRQGRDISQGCTLNGDNIVRAAAMAPVAIQSIDKAALHGAPSPPPHTLTDDDFIDTQEKAEART
ncbi:hypothetical protein EAH80_17780 [Mycobacterium hodleri]|uniref:Uncharacterized protein n=1 Tax=Mycolicibacterium hodleri TaxID=49897 RepID=A0A502E593_9MYCO|nr:hypothetical protein EAH80_17780 [Mycolicibacterium hodleri]